MTSTIVIGGGASGIGAAHTLRRAGVDVTLVESSPRLGGNCVGLPVVAADGTRHTVDVGVSDFNRTTFTELSRLIDELGLPTRPICGDAHFVSPDGETLAACKAGAWTFRRDVGDRAALLAEMDAFRTRALEVLRDERFATMSVGEYLDHIGASRAFRELYLLPRAMGCFPMPDRAPEQAEIVSLVRFWNVHGLVSDLPADRHTVVGGMHRWVRAWQDRFLAEGGRVLCATRVTGVRRGPDGVEVRTSDVHGMHRTLRADHVVFANHASQALPLLDGATEREREALSSFVVQRADVVVHQDASLMGDEPALRGGYHYVVPQGPRPLVRPTITFFPNRIGSLPSEVPDVFVSMNPHVAPRPETVLAARTFLHPVGCAANDRAAERVEAIQGERRTWYAGAHLRAPYVHESALRSGMAVARAIVRREASARVATAA
ncbi:MAG: FAD-dependent oxidoreductase [Planctomycetes bacterium]|nr:FAD-dependent oxidoreductase [Planctomycetota bacterium]